MRKKKLRREQAFAHLAQPAWTPARDA
ncbi:hypothetical protein PBI_SEBATA_51 [Mycobacterium phage Sebata]|uniref:Uncharacterized protein n=5 Tax=Bixzunavirus TaxID=680114 RepID=A0A411CCL1_9CAUD|nr:hypothetical protein AWH68_gp050 [Mycobacterium phage Breeniome]YP_009608736.1 hypothetical protein FDI20_gp051 [Mycobacterium phage Sebata]YP_010057923.1 hypothetical protein KHO62_gp049 [Mycobacterium phage NoodleTree]YP_010510459.1 hypothetical protein OLP41_gp051 [Mycobacterium phage I3]AER49567.1 hypothetical protein PIO_53 [Mycobacterium phage Pio]AOZ63406.1 hypothetical protein SEA_GABRIEL_50 [Mycobacterium phage Gabriel]AEK06528.1 hypothetical protein PBI_SEBATA_51 [Mycobacterium p